MTFSERRNQSLETKTLLDQLLDVAEEFKGEDVKALEVTERCSFTDFFLLVTGTSSLTIGAMAEAMIYKCKHMGRPPLHVEGLNQGEWVLLDYGDIVVHLFTQERRDHFDLESLWTGARPPSDEAAEAEDAPASE